MIYTLLLRILQATVSKEEEKRGRREKERVVRCLSIGKHGQSERLGEKLGSFIVGKIHGEG